MDTIGLLIADGHALFREGLRALFSAVPDIAVVGEAADGAAAVIQVDTSQLDIIIFLADSRLQIERRRFSALGTLDGGKGIV